MAYQNTRVIKALDLVRDAAIDGNAQTPPLFSENATRKVVTAHRAALIVINASGSGWQAIVSASLDELVRDQSLLPAEVQRITPYISLIKSILVTLS